MDVGDPEAMERKRTIAKVAIAAIGLAVLSRVQTSSEANETARIACMAAFAAYMAHAARKVFGPRSPGDLHEPVQSTPSPEIRLAALKKSEGLGEKRDPGAPEVGRPEVLETPFVAAIPAAEENPWELIENKFLLAVSAKPLKA